MFMSKRTMRPIGRILLDGGFLSHPDLGFALEEQKRTNELLGQVLVRMGVLDSMDIKAVLSVQEHLDCAEDVVKTAAGVRRMLGELLVQAGHITNKQLEQALAEQKRSKEKLGEVLMRQGLLTGQQLEGVLDFQRNQDAGVSSPGPLRLGELLVSTGAISRGQLDYALQKQAGTLKKLGEVLVEQGYARPHQIKRGVRLQQMLLTAALVALLAACGSGAGAPEINTPASTSAAASSNAGQQQAYVNYLTVTLDEYGLVQPNFYYSTNNNSFWSIQADVAQNVWDPNFASVIRIDIPKAGDGELPGIGGKTYAIEDNPLYEKFPGSFLVFNGQRSTLKKVEQGTISFTPDTTAADKVNGAFDVVLVDHDSTTIPAPQYHLKGVFKFKMGTYGPSASTITAAAEQ